MEKWVKVVSDHGQKVYRIYHASGIGIEPAWPKLTFAQLLNLCFGDRVIRDANHPKWVSTTIRRARIGSRMACQADERTGNLSELPRSKAEIQGWFAGIALARSRIDATA